MRTLFAPLALALLLSPAAPAQTKAKAPARKAAKAPAAPASAPPAKVTLGQVHDRRSDSSPFKRLEINLELPEVQAADVVAARTVVTAAVDDTGKNLVPEDSGKGGLQPTQRMGPGGSSAKPQPAQVTVELKNPARKASMVKSVTGEIELYMPGKDPNGTASIPKFLAQGDKTLASPALAANGVSISVVGPARLEAEKKKQLEKLKADAKKEKLDADTLKDRLDYFESEFLKPEEGEVVLMVKAPEGRIQEFLYVDPAGEEKPASVSQKQGFVVLSTWSAKPDPEWGLKVRMKTPKTLARYSLALKDVPLP